MDAKAQEKAPPPKIIAAFKAIGEPREQLLMLLKTNWKPSFNIPTLWLALTTTRIVLFSTAGGGQVYSEALFTELNDVTLRQTDRLVQILFSDLQRPDWKFYISSSTPIKLLIEFASEAKRRVHEST